MQHEPVAAKGCKCTIGAFVWEVRGAAGRADQKQSAKGRSEEDKETCLEGNGISLYIHLYASPQAFTHNSMPPMHYPPTPVRTTTVNGTCERELAVSGVGTEGDVTVATLT